MAALSEALVEAALEPLLPDGSFSREQLQLLHRLGAQRKAVVLAFPPKSAGTFFRSAIISAVDGQLVRVVHALGGRDATPYLPTLLEYYAGGVTEKTLVTHVHMLGLPANIHMLSAFRIRPIIIKRNIPDMLASYWDMLDSDADAFLSGLNCSIPEGFRSWPNSAKADFMVDMLGPWYVKYYAGWLGRAQADPESVCVIDYTDLKDDPVAVLQRCMKFVGLPRSREACEAAVVFAWDRRRSLRFNKGVEGRGLTYLRSVHFNRLSRMMGYYPVLESHRHDLLDYRQNAKKQRNAKRA